MRPYLAYISSTLRLVGRDRSVLFFSYLFPFVFFFIFAQLFGAKQSPSAMAQVIAMVERCPSGALTHRVDQRSGMPISRLEPSMPPSTRMSRPVTYEPASDDR